MHCEGMSKTKRSFLGVASAKETRTDTKYEDPASRYTTRHNTTREEDKPNRTQEELTEPDATRHDTTRPTRRDMNFK